MIKRAKDVTMGDLLVVDDGLMVVTGVGTDLYAGITLIASGTYAVAFDPYEEVETLG